MAMTICPNCGKQLRPGARFCGSCGTTLTAAQAGKGTGMQAQLSDDSLPCPNCGKPVRRGAKFCSHCGYTIEVDNTAQTTVSSTTVVGQSSQVDARAIGEGRPPVAKPAIPPPVAVKSRRTRLPLVLLSGAAVLCLAVAAGGYLVANRRGWIGAERATPTQTMAVAVVATEISSTIIPTISPTAAAALVSTPIVPTNTLEITPTSIPASPTSLPPSPTSGVTLTLLNPSPTITATIPISGINPVTQTVLEDTFDRILSENWLTWGDPRPTIDSGPTDKWLALNADDPGAGGVTTRSGVTVMNIPGLEIEFDGVIRESYPRSVIFLDWDPEQTRRGPELKDPGLIRVGVRSDTITLQTPLTRQVCNAPVEGFKQHRYRVRVIEGQGVELFVDESEAPVCTVDFLGLATVPGRVSFSGLGWVTYVKIVQPAVAP